MNKEFLFTMQHSNLVQKEHLDKLLLNLNTINMYLKDITEIAPTVFKDIKQIRKFISKINLNKKFDDEELNLIYFYAGDLEANVILMVSRKDSMGKREMELVKLLVSFRSELNYMFHYKFHTQQIHKEIVELRSLKR